MKPSDSPDYIALLTTKPELSMLEAAIQKADPDTLGTIEDGIASRFYLQTKEPVPGLGSQTVEERFRLNATFPIKKEDVSFVIRAAQGTLAETNTVERVLNRVTGRTKAAKSILESLVYYK